MARRHTVRNVSTSGGRENNRDGPRARVARGQQRSRPVATPVRPPRAGTFSRNAHMPCNTTAMPPTGIRPAGEGGGTARLAQVGNQGTSATIGHWRHPHRPDVPHGYASTRGATQGTGRGRGRLPPAAAPIERAGLSERVNTPLPPPPQDPGMPPLTWQGRGVVILLKRLQQVAGDGRQLAGARETIVRQATEGEVGPCAVTRARRRPDDVIFSVKRGLRGPVGLHAAHNGPVERSGASLPMTPKCSGRPTEHPVRTRCRKGRDTLHDRAFVRTHIETEQAGTGAAGTEWGREHCAGVRDWRYTTTFLPYRRPGRRILLTNTCKHTQ